MPLPIDKYLPPVCSEHSQKLRGCPTCRIYHTAAKRRARRMRAAGLPVFGDLPEVTNHVQALLAAGLTQRRLAAVSGVDVTTIRRVLSGRKSSIFASTAKRLLDVPVPHQIALIGVMRRTQALTAAGFSAEQIGRAVGVSADAVQNWREGRRPPKKMWANKLSSVYSQMWELSGTSKRSLDLAQARGWLPPEAWDSLTIDDPNAQPYDHIDTDYVDEVKVKRALDGQVRFADLNRAERLAMLKEAGVTGPERSTAFRNRYGVNLQQLRVAFGLVEDGRRRPGTTKPDPQIGARVKAALKGAGILQQDLAVLFGPGCSPAHISRRVRGVVGFPEQDLRRIAEITGTTYEYLLKGRDERAA